MITAIVSVVAIEIEANNLEPILICPEQDRSLSARYKVICESFSKKLHEEYSFLTANSCSPRDQFQLKDIDLKRIDGGANTTMVRVDQTSIDVLESRL